MKYEIGVMSASFPNIPLNEGIQKIAENGFNLIELSSEQLEDYVLLTKNGLSILNNLRDDLGLNYTVHGPITGLNLDAPIEKIRKNSLRRLEWYINTTAALDSDILVLHPVSLTPIKSDFYTMRNNVLVSLAKETLPKMNHWLKEVMLRNYEVLKVRNSLMEVYPTAEAKKVSISCENHFYAFEKLEDFYFILKENKPYLNFTFDPAHALISGNFGSPWLKVMQKKMDHVHATDSDGKNDSHPELGKINGPINWEELLSELKKIDYRGNLILENYRFENAIESKKYLESL